ncbi:precorrin-2 dehydrogenase/sirohydrochlorin ferrochelatase family protein [Desulfuribacillus alkaliarsenatis]|uniref:precorrin-2 dehydrogenase n=1 Tax=Desulfuribacillus alkaliarsenatis TaxID=766136 RepID=A0A1E5G7Q2_9FIRM|nr:bifunctional precorrin-2 dehydrogenase/sirohydrochlorin ferrochelatase [Desulfuribacillus alkaliarsenatis]OEF98764.1 hypothetical protein BHF68_01115 [Desulfuribacillus alkaliarsenatis]
MERFYPIFLRIKDKLCVVVGGGNVAERKVMTLLEDGAKVKVISPDITKTLSALAEAGEVEWKPRYYEVGDLLGAFLVYAATNSQEVNQQVYTDAQKHSILVNTIDNQELCDFIVPSRIDKGKLQICISTSGASPALAKQIREELEEHFCDEYQMFLDWMQQLREWLLKNEPDEQTRRQIFKQAVQSPILELLREQRIEEARAIIHSYTKELILTDQCGCN